MTERIPLDKKDRVLLKSLASQLVQLDNPYYVPQFLDNIIKDLQDIQTRNFKHSKEKVTK